MEKTFPVTEKMNRQLNPSLERRKRLRRHTLQALAIIASAGLAWYLLDEPEPASVGEAPPIGSPQPAPNAESTAPSRRLAVAMRQGRCRTFAHHLRGMAGADNNTELEAKRKAMGLLAGEMMNDYPKGGAVDSNSDAILAVTTDEGQRGLNEARDDFLETLRSVKGMNGADAAAKVSKSCMACHSQFVRNGGKSLSLITVNSAGR